MHHHHHHHHVTALGIDISRLSSPLQLTILASGVFICFLLYGICQELITANWKQHHVHLGWFLTCIQCGMYSLLVWMFIGRRSSSNNNNNSNNMDSTAMTTTHRSPPPLPAYVLIGILSMLTIGLSNSAVEFLSYSTQVAFKSSKPVPVQILGVCILGKRYAVMEYFATFILTLGLIMFALGDSNAAEENHFDVIGIVLICSALIVDGVIGNVQQRVFKDYDLSPNEMIMKTKGFASLFAGIICLVNGQLVLGITFSWHHPHSLLPMICYCACGVIGEGFVMALMKRFGALAAVITTSVRKMFTVALSFIIFQHTFSSSYAMACLLVIIGVGMHVYLDHRRHSAVVGGGGTRKDGGGV